MFINAHEGGEVTVDGRTIPSPANLSDVDPPLHAVMRSLAIRVFTPGRLRLLEGRMRAIATQVVQSFESAGRVEFVEAFAKPFPMQVIVEMLGLPEDRIPDFRRWSDDQIERRSEFVSPERRAALRQSADEFATYLWSVIEDRRQHPKPDAIGEVVAAADQLDNHLEQHQLLGVVNSLLVAGNTTTTQALGSTMWLLARDPAQLEALRTDGTLVRRIVEESLRIESPTQWLPRRCARSTELDGVTIPAGSRVILMFASGNRDPRHFANPAVFDHTRPNLKDILTFGHGIHFCLGAPLARLEARLMLEVVCERLPGIRLAAGQDFAHLRVPVVRGLRQLWLEWDPRQAQ